MGPHPAVAAIRLAVRRVLHDILTEHHSEPGASPGLPSGTAAGFPTGATGAFPSAASPGRTSGRPAAGSPEMPSAGPREFPLGAQREVPTAGLARTGSAEFPSAATHESGRTAAREAGRTAGRAGARDAAPGATMERPPAPLVLVACSGGADSMALASALAFEAPRLGVRAGGITVDHGLQPGSDLRAEEVVLRLRALGLDPVESVTVSVGRDGGPEAAARDARYAALDAAAERHGAAAVLLGHTRDDQAETVLLGLARGSGIRSLSGMAAVSGAGGRYRRPFLQLDRQTARKACMVQSLPVWDDPHNADPAYTRSRLRHEGLPALEKALGKGVVEALARTAQLSRDDADALDCWAREAEAGVRDGAGRLECGKLYALPPAVRRRILRRAAIEAGCPAGSLFARHIEEVDRLITSWRGQGAINLPGRVVARRQGGRLVIRQG